AIYDIAQDQMVIFGGYGASGRRNDVWALSLSGTPTWSAITPTGMAPSPRHGQVAIYDPIRSRMVVFGGFDGATWRNDIWALSLSGTPTWTQINTSGLAPVGRYFHSAIYDQVRDRMVVLGGYGSTGRQNDVWALSLSGTPSWSQLTPSG